MSILSPMSVNRTRVAPQVIVPFADLRTQFSQLRSEILEAVTAVADSGNYVLGPRVAAFEEAFAAAHGVRHAIGVNSGTSALHLALLAAGVGPNDEVLTVPMTFIATSWAISYCGARPVFVDIDPTTYTMDPNQVADRITPRTKAILPVHLYGQPANMPALLEIGARHGIPVIEDAAQAHLARCDGRSVGGFGLAAGFSFYPGKNLGACGEGGAVVTNDDTIADRMRSLRDHAQTKRYHHNEIGFNYRLDALQGAVLGLKFKHLMRWTERRQELAHRYLSELQNLPLGLPAIGEGREHVWHLFVVTHPERDTIRQRLEELGIQTGLHYPVAVHLQPAYRHLGYGVGDFPVAERVARECLSLPLYPEMSITQQDAVVTALADTVCR